MAIVFDTFGTFTKTTGGSTISWSHTVGAGEYGAIFAFPLGALSGSISSIKFAGQAMTRILSGTNVNAVLTVEMWYLANPPAGLGTFNGTWSGTAGEFDNVSVSYFNVNQSVPIAGSTSFIGTLLAAGSITRAFTTTNPWFIGCAGYDNNSAVTTTNGIDRGTAASGGLVVGMDSTGGTLRNTTSGNENIVMLGAEVESVQFGNQTIGYKNLLNVGQ